MVEVRNWTQRLQSAARCEAGKLRRRNEDACLDRSREGLWAVADGIGGQPRGDLASRLVVDELAALALSGSLDERERRVTTCLQQLNRRLADTPTVIAGQPASLIGSTVVVLLSDAERATCLWAGDSRCYLLRAGRLHLLTHDHNQMRLLIEDGVPPAQAALHPQAQALTRALGIDEDLLLERRGLDLYPGDVLLLCSDGLYQSLSREQLGDALQSCNASVALRKLFEAALKGPARDNRAAIVVRP